MKYVVTIFVVLISALLAHAQNDIHKVDFKNFTFQIPNAAEKLTVQDGMFTSDTQSLLVSEVVYGDVDGDGKDDAVVLTYLTLLKNEETFYDAEVFTIKNDKPILMATIKGGGLEEIPNIELHVKVKNGIVNVDRSGKLHFIKIEKGVFTISDSREFRNDQALTSQYKWDGTRLKEVGSPIDHLLHPEWRILFPGDKTSVTLKIKIPKDGSKSIIVSGKKGQVLTITTDAVKDYARRTREPMFIISLEEPLDDNGFQKLQKGITFTLNETRDYIIEFHHHFDRDLVFSATIKLK